MRDIVASSPTLESKQAKLLREDCISLLEEMMHSMKINCQELNQESLAQGVYLSFVQSVLGYMEQFTVNHICPIDRYFTESGMFSSLMDNPTYVMSRIKSYEFNLSSTSVQKQLVSFIFSLSEAAAINQKQCGLIAQLSESMLESEDLGGPGELTLRSFLMQAVIPTFMELNWKDQGAWIVVRPMLEVARIVIQDMVYSFNWGSTCSVNNAIQVLNEILWACCTAMNNIERFKQQVFEAYEGDFDTPRRYYETTSLLLSIVSTCVKPLHVILQQGYSADTAINCIKQIISNFLPVASSDRQEPFIPKELAHSFLTTRVFCRKEFIATTKSWAMDKKGVYYFSRGNMRRRVEVQASSLEETQEAHRQAEEDLLREVSRTAVFGGDGGKEEDATVRRKMLAELIV